jgi:hypothetical protein
VSGSSSTASSSSASSSSSSTNSSASFSSYAAGGDQLPYCPTVQMICTCTQLGRLAALQYQPHFVRRRRIASHFAVVTLTAVVTLQQQRVCAYTCMHLSYLCVCLLCTERFPSLVILTQGILQEAHFCNPHRPTEQPKSTCNSIEAFQSHCADPIR